MRTADKEVAGIQRADDLRRTRDERNHAFGLRTSQVVQMLPPGNNRNQNPDGVRHTLIPTLLPSATRPAKISLGS
jgi:hypothetical protein